MVSVGVSFYVCGTVGVVVIVYERKSPKGGNWICAKR